MGVSNSLDSSTDITCIFQEPGIVFNTVPKDVVKVRRALACYPSQAQLYACHPADIEYGDKKRDSDLSDVIGYLEKFG